MQWRWCPFLTIDGGGVIDGDGGGVEDTAYRVDLRTFLEINLPGVARTIGFKQVAVSANHHFFYLSEESETYDYLTLTAEFMFNENIGFSLDYNNGRNGPSFVKEETFSGGLTVKF